MTADVPLAGRHALVTGGGRGIGAAIAEALARAGARVTITGRDEGRLRETAADINANVFVRAMDVSDRAAVAQAFAAARQVHGAIDVLVNNAGQAQSAPLLRTDSALFERMLSVNVLGTYNCVHEALPDMLAGNFGRIVNIASTAGLSGYAYCTAYCAAKHAVVGFTRALAMETARKNVTVNAVCPGFTDTDIVREAVTNIRSKTGRSEAEAIASLVEKNPQQRLVAPAEVAGAVLWLCAPGSESITGQSIAVAGGEVM